MYYHIEHGYDISYSAGDFWMLYNVTVLNLVSTVIA